MGTQYFSWRSWISGPQSRRAMVLWLMVFSWTPALADPPTYRFGVVPQQSASRLAEMWIPLLRVLSGQTGLNFEFRTAQNIPEFERRVIAGEYDFAYMNPYHFVVFNEYAGYRAVAHEKNKRIQGIMVVRKDARLQQLADLTGHKVCFPSPAAFAASLLPRAELERKQISITPVFVGSHDSVYLNVEAGQCLAGGGIKRTFEAMPSEIRERLKILAETGRYTPHAFAASKEVSPAALSTVQKALVALKQTNPDVLQNAALGELSVATEADWDDVRSLDARVLLRLANFSLDLD
jgi:phosphonate transport system substrate-binding protein